MKPVALGLTCLTTAMTSVVALDVDLKLGPNEAVITSELLNQHWSNNVLRNDSATGHLGGSFRFFNIGIKVDGYLALDGHSQEEIGDFEVTEMSLRIDYLIKMEQYFQILPFFEMSSYPYDSGRPAFVWAGAEGWYLTPLEGLEAGASMRFNLADSRSDAKAADPDNHAVITMGARYLYQEAPLDAMGWLLTDIANRAFHLATTGTETRGIQTVKLGGRLTLPLPWEEMWLYGQAENIWFVHPTERDHMRDTGQDRSVLTFALGVEWRAE